MDRKNSSDGLELDSYGQLIAKTSSYSSDLPSYENMLQQINEEIVVPSYQSSIRRISNPGHDRSLKSNMQPTYLVKLLDKLNSKSYQETLLDVTKQSIEWNHTQKIHESSADLKRYSSSLTTDKAPAKKLQRPSRSHFSDSNRRESFESYDACIEFWASLANDRKTYVSNLCDWTCLNRIKTYVIKLCDSIKEISARASYGGTLSIRSGNGGASLSVVNYSDRIASMEHRFVKHMEDACFVNTLKNSLTSKSSCLQSYDLTMTRISLLALSSVSYASTLRHVAAVSTRASGEVNPRRHSLIVSALNILGVSQPKWHMKVTAAVMNSITKSWMRHQIVRERTHTYSRKSVCATLSRNVYELIRSVVEYLRLLSTPWLVVDQWLNAITERLKSLCV